MTIFFFQAEDGIRDKLVTGVQTCALPISPAILRAGPRSVGATRIGRPASRRRRSERRVGVAWRSVEYELRPLLGRGAQAPPGARRLRSPGHGSAYALTGSAPAPAPSARRPSGTG